MMMPIWLLMILEFGDNSDVEKPTHINISFKKYQTLLEIKTYEPYMCCIGVMVTSVRVPQDDASNMLYGRRSGSIEIEHALWP